MSSKFKIGGFVVLLLVAVTSYVIFQFYVENDIDIETAETEIYISASQLLSSFESDEHQASDTFIEKVIEVSGKVKEVNDHNNRYTILLKGDDQNFNCILCDMQADQFEKVKNIKPGQDIKLKGVFKGYLKDAILLNCILLNYNHQ